MVLRLAFKPFLYSSCYYPYYHNDANSQCNVRGCVYHTQNVYTTDGDRERQTAIEWHEKMKHVASAQRRKAKADIRTLIFVSQSRVLR